MPAYQTRAARNALRRVVRTIPVQDLLPRDWQCNLMDVIRMMQDG